ncbi:CTLH/CRA C-terminal to lish motif domain-containing protein [Gongronella butleri]|nr:CTLH/CRA C-terminal to lish motif domain-containing protein [Gongronella butleri]
MDATLNTKCRDIIMEYLVHSCYKDTARAFLQETRKLPAEQDHQDQQNAISTDTHTNGQVLGKKADNAWHMLDARKDLYDAIYRGDIPKAFDLIRLRFSGILEDTDHNHAPGSDKARACKVMFKLRCQQFIEIVRSASEVDAIQYARQHLKPIHKDYQEMITEVASLIAYNDPEKSNQAHLLSQDRRRKLADEVNRVVLAYCDLPEQTTMERLHRQHQVVQQELETMDWSEDKLASREKMSM